MPRFLSTFAQCSSRLAGLRSTTPPGPKEPKWDGFQVIALMRDGSVRVLSRNLHSFTTVFRPVTEALRVFPTSLVLDGEIVVVGEDGRPDFETLQGWLRPRKARPTDRLT